jgi:hypothetical protein
MINFNKIFSITFYILIHIILLVLVFQDINIDQIGLLLHQVI